MDEAIVADFTPSSQRGRWRIVESMNDLTWSGTAVLGGWVADRTGSYGTMFEIVGMIFFLATLLYIPLLWLVPREESLEEALGIEAESSSEVNSESAENSDLEGMN